MTAQVDMALDLSAKPSSLSQDSVDSSKPPSPSASLSSDLDTSYDRPSSVLSEHDADKSCFVGYNRTGINKSLPGHMHLGFGTDDRVSPTDSGSNGRPFKMFPFDSVPSGYSPLTQGAAALAAAGLYGPFSGNVTQSVASLTGMGSVLDSPLSLSSPISQYIQQKKRRSENRMSTPKDIQPTSSPGDISSTSTSGTIKPHSPTPSSMSDYMDEGNEPPCKKPREDLSIDERREMSYWDRRRKNNEAAKRSRDARRQKEEEIALRAAYLEQENLKLRAQVTILKNETTKLHYMLYNRL